MRKQPRLLVFAHACGPDAGSEPGAGWGMVMAMAEIADLIVLTGSARIADIRKWETAHRRPNLEFVEVPDHISGRLLRWHRIPHFLQNQIWLRKARKRALVIVAAERIDAVSHVTLSAYWMPTPAVALGLPSIWGPVGGAVTTPRTLWPLLGRGGALQERLDRWSIKVAASLPATRRTARMATTRLIQNRETRDALPSGAQENVHLLNHALFNETPETDFQPDGRYALWAALMETRKGGRIAIEAVARTRSDTKLVMVGDGPQRQTLEKLARQLGVADRVEFTGWIPRERAIELMQGATTVLFTGLREEGGLALTEAMYNARRVIVLEHGGAGSIGRRATDSSRIALIQPESVDSVLEQFARAIDQHFETAEPEPTPLLDRNAAMQELEEAILEAIGQRATPR